MGKVYVDDSISEMVVCLFIFVEGSVLFCI